MVGETTTFELVEFLGFVGFLKLLRFVGFLEFVEILSIFFFLSARIVLAPTFLAMPGEMLSVRREPK